MPDDGQLGRIFVELGADLEPLRKELADGVSDVKAFGKDIDAAADKAVEGFERLGSGLFVSKQLREELDRAADGLDNLADETKPVANTLERLGDAFEDVSISIGLSRQDFEAFGAAAQKLGGRLQKVGGTLTVGVTAPLLAAGAGLTALASSFESAFAGVEKTVEATGAELAELRNGILELSTRVPASAADISAVAEAAGQLGIATPDVLDFSEVMIGLGEATDLGATEAATALARFSNITKAGRSDFERLGSTIVGLGNTFATTESQILTLGLRLAAAGKQTGFTEAQTLGLAAALSSLGIEAEAGGSALSKALLDIQSAALAGGEDISRFARIAGQSTEEFRTAFLNDAPRAFQSFVNGLGEIQRAGGDVAAALDAVGFAEVRQRDALLRLAGASGVLADAFDTSTEAYADNAALSAEVAKRYDTLESQLAQVKNAALAAVLPLGEELVEAAKALIPAVEGAIDILADLVKGFTDLPEPVKATTGALVGFAAAAGPAAFTIGKLAEALGTLTIAAAGTGATATRFAKLGAGLRLLATRVAPAIAAFLLLKAGIDRLTGQTEIGEDLTTPLVDLSDVVSNLSDEIGGFSGAGLLEGLRAGEAEAEALATSLAEAKQRLADLEASGRATRNRNGLSVETQAAKDLRAEIVLLERESSRLGRSLTEAKQNIKGDIGALRALYAETSAAFRESGDELTSGQKATLAAIEAQIKALSVPFDLDPPSADETEALAAALRETDDALKAIGTRRGLGLITSLDAARAEAEAFASALDAALESAGGELSADVTRLAGVLRVAEERAERLARAFEFRQAQIGIAAELRAGVIGPITAAEARVAALRDQLVNLYNLDLQGDDVAEEIQQVNTALAVQIGLVRLLRGESAAGLTPTVEDLDLSGLAGYEAAAEDAAAAVARIADGISEVAFQFEQTFDAAVFDGLAAGANAAASGIADAFTDNIGRVFGVLSSADRQTLISLDESEVRLRRAFEAGRVSAAEYRAQLARIEAERDQLATGFEALKDIGVEAFNALLNGLKAFVAELLVAIARQALLTAIFSAINPAAGGFLGVLKGAAGNLGGFSRAAAVAAPAIKSTEAAAAALGLSLADVRDTSTDTIPALREVGREADKTADSLERAAGTYALRYTATLTASSDEAIDAAAEAAEALTSTAAAPYVAVLTVDADDASRAAADVIAAFRVAADSYTATLRADAGDTVDVADGAREALGRAAVTYTARLEVLADDATRETAATRDALRDVSGAYTVRVDADADAALAALSFIAEATATRYGAILDVDATGVRPAAEAARVTLEGVAVAYLATIDVDTDGALAELDEAADAFQRSAATRYTTRLEVEHDDAAAAARAVTDTLEAVPSEYVVTFEADATATVLASADVIDAAERAGAALDAVASVYTARLNANAAGAESEAGVATTALRAVVARPYVATLTADAELLRADVVAAAEDIDRAVRREFASQLALEPILVEVQGLGFDALGEQVGLLQQALTTLEAPALLSDASLLPTLAAAQTASIGTIEVEARVAADPVRLYAEGPELVGVVRYQEQQEQRKGKRNLGRSRFQTK